MTSIPNSNGICNLVFLTAYSCNSLIFVTERILNTPPTLPSFTFCAISELLTAPVTKSLEAGRFN